MFNCCRFIRDISISAKMKSPPAVTDDCDDIFGPPRTYATGYMPPKQRPSMISAKYRQKEERRKVLKISINKLKKIEDPEASLCRSVLINNTMKRLQKEARDEKLAKQQLNYPRCYENDNFLNLKSEFIKNEMKTSNQSSTFEEPQEKIMESLKVDFVDFDTAKMTEELSAKNLEVLNGLVEENLKDLTNFSDNTTTTNNVNALDVNVNDNNTTSDRFTSRKRSYDDVDDCDVQAVLSQFYMPPTPRMLTCIDDDEEVNVTDDQPEVKRARTEVILDSTQIQCLDEALNETLSNNVQYNTTTTTTNDLCHHNDTFNHRLNENMDVVDKKEEFSVKNFINNNIPDAESRLRYNTQADNDTAAYSCGHSSIFNDLQTNVFHSLIASLET